jgi:hypothetical protein
MEQNKALLAVTRQVDKALVDGGCKRPYWEQNELTGEMSTEVSGTFELLKSYIVKAHGCPIVESLSPLETLWRLNQKQVFLRDEGENGIWIYVS